MHRLLRLGGSHCRGEDQQGLQKVHIRRRDVQGSAGKRATTADLFEAGNAELTRWEENKHRAVLFYFLYHWPRPTNVLPHQLRMHPLPLIPLCKPFVMLWPFE